MTVPAAIPFALSGVVLLWAVASAAMAFTGGVSSGLHHVAKDSTPDEGEPVA